MWCILQGGSNCETTSVSKDSPAASVAPLEKQMPWPSFGLGMNQVTPQGEQVEFEVRTNRLTCQTTTPPPFPSWGTRTCHVHRVLKNVSAPQGCAHNLHASSFCIARHEPHAPQVQNRFLRFCHGLCRPETRGPPTCLLNLEDAMAHLGGLGAGRSIDGGE